MVTKRRKLIVEYGSIDPRSNAFRFSPTGTNRDRGSWIDIDRSPLTANPKLSDAFSENGSGQRSVIKRVSLIVLPQLVSEVRRTPEEISTS
jgi:hypothetical protein